VRIGRSLGVLASFILAICLLVAIPLSAIKYLEWFPRWVSFAERVGEGLGHDIGVILGALITLGLIFGVPVAVVIAAVAAVVATVQTLRKR